MLTTLVQALAFIVVSLVILAFRVLSLVFFGTLNQGETNVSRCTVGVQGL